MLTNFRRLGVQLSFFLQIWLLAGLWLWTAKAIGERLPWLIVASSLLTGYLWVSARPPRLVCLGLLLIVVWVGAVVTNPVPEIHGFWWVAVAWIGWCMYPPRIAIGFGLTVWMGGLLTAKFAHLLILNNPVEKQLWWTMSGGYAVINGLLACLYYLGAECSKAQEQSERLRVTASNYAEANVRLQDYADQSIELELTKERARMARDIHDTLGHTLTTIIMRLQGIRSLVVITPLRVPEEINQTIETARQGMDEVRRSISLLREQPSHLVGGRARWVRLIEAFSETTEVRVTYKVGEDFTQLPQAIDDTIYRVIQEGLTNAYRHGNASLVDVRVAWERGRFLIRISDNGLGVENLAEGYGLKGLRERVEQIGGSIAWRSDLGYGFDLGIQIPAQGGRAINDGKSDNTDSGRG